MTDASATAVASSSKPQAETQEQKGPKQKMRRLRWVLLVVLVLGFVFLPQIIAATSLRNSVVAFLRPELPEGVTVRSATFAWWEPVMLAGVDIPDDEGRPMFTVEHITTDRTLWDIVILGNKPSAIDIEQPSMLLRVSETGTNLDPILQRLKEQPAHAPRAVQVHITDASVEILQEESDSALISCADLVVQLQMTNGPEYAFTLASEGWATPAVATLATINTPSRLRLAANWNSTYAGGFILGPGEFSMTADEVVANALLELIPGLSDRLEVTGNTLVSISGVWEEIADDTLGGTIELSTSSEALTITPIAENGFFNEPVMLDGEIGKISSQFLYSRREDLLEVGRLEIASRWLTIRLSGEVRKFSTECEIDLAGTAEGDAAPWIDLLPNEVSDNLTLEGIAVKDVALVGTLRPPAADSPTTPDFTAEVGLVWTTAVAWGLTSNDGELRLGWDGEALALDPVQVPFNGGRVSSLPDVLFRDEGAVLRFEPGTLFEIAEVDEEIARQWLRYLSPLLASATSVQGSLSLSTAGGEVPLNRWQQSDFEGKLTIHEARVSPGPRARTILSLARQFEQIVRLGAADTTETTLLTMPTQDITLSIRDERVHHDKLILLAGDVEMNTSGSVGFDESLELTFGLPIQDEWIEDRPLIGAALQGETISLGMGGTLDDPDLNTSPLRDLSVRMGIRAGGRALLDRLLDRDNDED